METIALHTRYGIAPQPDQQQGCTKLSSENPSEQPGNRAELQALTELSAPPPALIGSGWDVGAAAPDAPLPHHLAQWVEASACHPALAAANVQSLRGPAVLEALAGERLAQLGGHAQQHVTAAAARLLAPLEPIAEAGGWWCSGLDPRTDWDGWNREQAWGTFKPDRPRWDPARNRARKYEHPVGVPARLFWLRVPAVVAQRVADRFELTLPADVAADATGERGAFWRWWARERRLPLLIAEGARKAGALLSAGVPSVAAPGVWNPSAGRELHPDLAAVPLAGRACWVLFDRPDPTRDDPPEPIAAARLGRLLEAAGASEVRVGTCPGPEKGADDALAAGVSWETLAAALQPLTLAPALPQLRRPDVVAPAGCYLGESVTIPALSRVVALATAMGSGKTALLAAHVAPLLATGVRVVLVTHRRSLGEALAERLGLPWGDDAAPGSDLRQQGIGLCIDSLWSGSRMSFNPADWRGCLVVVDEVTAVLAHAVMATGTDIARHRVPVLQALGDLLADARQVLIADAQLDNATLQAVEAAAGERAYLIGSAHRPAAGRVLIPYEERGQWYAELTAHLQRRQRLWISTTAAEIDTPNSAQNIAVLAERCWPGCRVLVVDRDTVGDPAHDAHRLAAAPDDIAGRYDVVVATPAIAAGLSVTLRRHFAAIFVACGGTTDPGAVAQAAGRVRDDVPRHLYAPDRSPGNHLRVGCGSVCPDRVMLHLRHHFLQTVGQLVAAGVNLATGSAGPWLPLWAQLAAQQNRARKAYAATVVGLLAREGYQLGQPTPDPETPCPPMLREMAEMNRAAARDRLITAEPLTDQEARQLEKRRGRLNPAERAQLQRWRIDRAWGLQGAAPSHALIEAHDDGAHRRVVFRWAVTDPAAAPLIAAHDRQQAQRQAPDGRAWAPDLTRATLGPRVAAAHALGLAEWLQRSDWFSSDDPAVQALAKIASDNGAAIAQVLGVTVTQGREVKPAKRATTTLRRLLAVLGARLEDRQVRTGPGRDSQRAYVYRVVVDPLGWRTGKGDPPLTDAVTPEGVVAAWRAQLGADGVTKNPPLEKRTSFETPDRDGAACDR